MESIVNKSFMERATAKQSEGSEIFQATLNFEEFKDACWRALELGRFAPKLKCSKVVASTNKPGSRYFYIFIEGTKYTFPASKKLAPGTSLSELSFGLTIPTDEYPDVLFIAFSAQGETELL